MKMDWEWKGASEWLCPFMKKLGTSAKTQQSD